MNVRSLLPALSALLVLGGCGAPSVSLTVDSEVPVPVTQKLPLRAGVYYDEKFLKHVYEEDSEDRPDWRIESGESQMGLFNQILSSLFTDLRRVNAVPTGPANAGLDLVIVPRIEEMQFSTPAEMKVDFYEAWIRYHVDVVKPDGTPVTDWQFQGYGKSSTEFLKNTTEGLSEAINIALRDAGAKLVVQFQALPEIQAMVERK